MAEWRLTQARDGVYERLLQRLALALERAEQNLQLSPGGEAELELTGLSPHVLGLRAAVPSPTGSVIVVQFSSRSATT